MRGRGHSAPLDAAARATAIAGEHGAIWLAIAAAGALRSDDPGPYRRAIKTVLGSYAANQLIKVAIRRPRPSLPGLPPLIGTTSNLSYPSAHATTSFAGARALAPLGPRRPLYALAAAIAVSRPYLGVHYLSDTLAGCALGVAAERLLR